VFAIERVKLSVVRGAVFRPYHQHQSLPSAASNDSFALASASALGAPGRPSFCADSAFPHASRASHNNFPRGNVLAAPDPDVKVRVNHEAGKIPLF